jgi:hypothetical protein
MSCRRRIDIPPELIDNIIDCLHDDIDTLRKCSIICSSWVASSRYHIFGHITLDHHSNEFGSLTSDCHRLYEVLEDAPQIALYIKHLVIHNGNSRGVNEERSLPLLLRALTCLETLDINPDQFVRSSVIWSGDLLNAIACAVSSDSFRELRVHASTFQHPVSVLRMLRSCRALKVLHLTNIGFLPWTQSLVPDSVIAQAGMVELETDSRGRIQVLSLDHPVIAGCLLHPYSPIDVTDIREFNLKIYGEFSGADARLLQSTPLVERLEITLMTDSELLLSFSLRDLPLTHFQLVTIIYWI